MMRKPGRFTFGEPFEKDGCYARSLPHLHTEKAWFTVSSHVSSSDYRAAVREPIIILGAPRSGTSFVGQLLAGHPDVFYVAEPRLTWKYGNDRKSDALRPEDARPEVKQHIGAAFGKRLAASGRRRLVEKTPSNSLRPGFVDEVFPDCRFLNIQRHGVDAALSIQHRWTIRAGGINPGAQNPHRGNRTVERLKELNVRRTFLYSGEYLRRAFPGVAGRVLGPPLWGPRLPGMTSMVKDLELWEVAAQQWKACVETATTYGRRLPADRYLELQIEQFNHGTIEKILDFCGLTADPGVLDAFVSSWSPEQLAGSRRAAAPDEVARLTRTLEPTLNWLGYEI